MSAGLTTMAFPGQIEDGVGKGAPLESERYPLRWLFIVSRLFQPRTAGNGPPGHHRGRDAWTLDDRSKTPGNRSRARIRAAPFGVCLSSLSPNQSLTIGLYSYILREHQPCPGLGEPSGVTRHGREAHETPANRRFHGEY